MTYFNRKILKIHCWVGTKGRTGPRALPLGAPLDLTIDPITPTPSPSPTHDIATLCDEELEVVVAALVGGLCQSCLITAE